MIDQDFAFLQRFLRRRSGLALGGDKRYLAESRLEPIWKAAGCGSLGDLVGKLRTETDPALAAAVVDAMMTNETSFFRDKSTFRALETVVLPRLIAARASTRRLRIWSAAASTGQEAYSVAMLLSEFSPRLSGWQITIVGTDISGAAVERARLGRYSQFEVQRGLPILFLLRYFNQGGEGWSVSDELRRLVRFQRLNLLSGTGPLGTFDLILCRNLLIYFDPPERAALLARLSDALAPDGLLCLGATETLSGLDRDFVLDPASRCFLKQPDGQAQAAREQPAEQGRRFSAAPAWPGSAATSAGAC